ncbi:MAG: hypothetical protein ACKN9D_02040, partial [Actinomycetales bacterium]
FVQAGGAVMEPGAYRLVLAVQEDLQVQIGDEGGAQQRVPMGSALVATAEEPALVVRTDGVAALVRHEQV